MPVIHGLDSLIRRMVLCGGGAKHLENGSTTPLSTLNHAFLNGPDMSTRILNAFGGSHQLPGSGIGTSDIAQPKPWLTRAVPAHGKVAVAASGAIWHSTGWKAEALLGRSRFLGRVAAQVNASSFYISCRAGASLGHLKARFLKSWHGSSYIFP